ncbi:MAG: hypothetical protein WCK77_12325 [Verrucomicrobiota bacterium]
MKSKHFAVTAALILCVMASPHALASTQPSIPVGSLTASPTVVQTGTKPTLTWSINYPSVVKNYLTITNGTGVTSALGATVTPNQNLICDIRILGAGVTTQNSNGTINYIETAAKLRYNGSSSWTTIFDGKQTDTIVQTQGIIKTLNVTSGKTMDFGGQYYYNGSWFTFFNSTNGTNVQTLVNGDACPSYIPAYNAPSLETFLKPYLDSSNKVRIGPMDVVVFMELTHTDKTNPGYDFQDLVLLVTFRTS